MKYFNQIYKAKLAVAIKEMEEVSSAEIVVIARPLSESYFDCSLITGGIFSLITFSILMFSDLIFGDYLIYSASIISFIIGFILTRSFNFILRAIIIPKRKKRSVEIMARALFQKAGIHHTISKTGILIYISLLEKQVFLLPDRGLENDIPSEELEKLNGEFQNIFKEKNPAESLINKLNLCKIVFAKYVPRDADDINELPNDLDVTI